MQLDAVAFAVLPPAVEVGRLVGDAVASRIDAGDVTLWPGAVRPGWTVAARVARPLVGEIEGLHERLRVAGMTRVVLAAAGGVGVAAEVLADGEPRLIVLDGTDPVQVADAVAGDLEATVLVVSAPPGEDTAGVELLWDTLAAAFRGEDLDPDAHTVVVTPPDGPLLARAGGATTVLGPADVDGPWAALTAFALVPAGLAGADVGIVLADAADTGPELATDDDANPALALGALLAAAPVVAVAGGGPLAEWVAQLIGAGLGKDGRGPLPVVVEAPGAPGWDTAGALTVALEAAGPADVVTDGPAGSQIVLWQRAAAVAAHVLGVDPTDRPDRGPLAGPSSDAGVGPERAFADGAVSVHAGDWLPPGTATVTAALRALLVGDPSHVALHAYLDPHDDASVAVLRPELSRRTGRLTTFGWAPRCLAGAGQRDKGGPAGAVVCQLTGSAGPAVAGPDPLGAFQRAQAGADAAALTAGGRRVLRLHLTDRVVGLVTLVRAVQEL